MIGCPWTRSDIPEQVRGFYRDIREYEPTLIVNRFVGDARTVLVIGDAWGREYFTLTARGCTVINIDIAWQPHLPVLAISDASQGIPFPPATFDAVVMGEVLEHLFDDVAALREVRRVLRDDGTLVVTVPFNHDAPEYHVRVHTAQTIRRLLQHSGFSIRTMIYRGGFISLPRLVGLAARLLGRQHVLNFCAELDLRVGSRRPWWFRCSPHFGAYLSARKGGPVDFAALNAAFFQLEATLQRERPVKQRA